MPDSIRRHEAARIAVWLFHNVNVLFATIYDRIRSAHIHTVSHMFKGNSRDRDRNRIGSITMLLALEITEVINCSHPDQDHLPGRAIMIR